MKLFNILKRIKVGHIHDSKDTPRVDAPRYVSSHHPNAVAWDEFKARNDERLAGVYNAEHIKKITTDFILIEKALCEGFPCTHIVRLLEIKGRKFKYTIEDITDECGFNY